MTPKSFDLKTCKSLVSDDLVRILEADAKEAAESFRDRSAIWRDVPTDGLIKEPKTYWETIEHTAQLTVWFAAHQQRKSKLDRMPDTNYFL